MIRKLYVEARGAVSEQNKRHGKAFKRIQVRTHMAAALFKVAEALKYN
jgi:hypothetical protein